MLQSTKHGRNVLGNHLGGGIVDCFKGHWSFALPGQGQSDGVPLFLRLLDVLKTAGKCGKGHSGIMNKNSTAEDIAFRRCQFVAIARNKTGDLPKSIKVRDIM